MSRNQSRKKKNEKNSFAVFSGRWSYPEIEALNWIVYIIRCSDESLYTGITTDLERRFREHSRGVRGARYFNGRSPVEVVYHEAGHDRSSASRREAAIKKLSREEKNRLVSAFLRRA